MYFQLIAPVVLQPLQTVQRLFLMWLESFTCSVSNWQMIRGFCDWHLEKVPFGLNETIPNENMKCRPTDLQALDDLSQRQTVLVSSYEGGCWQLKDFVQIWFMQTIKPYNRNVIDLQSRAGDKKETSIVFQAMAIIFNKAVLRNKVPD